MRTSNAFRERYQCQIHVYTYQPVLCVNAIFYKKHFTVCWYDPIEYLVQTLLLEVEREGKQLWLLGCNDGDKPCTCPGRHYFKNSIGPVPVLNDQTAVRTENCKWKIAKLYQHFLTNGKCVYRTWHYLLCRILTIHQQTVTVCFAGGMRIHKIK